MKNSPKSLSSRGTGGAVFVIAIALYLPLAGLDISRLDEGALLYVAERLTKGDVLYRDIVTGIMPGAYYLQALFFSIFGYSVVTGRVLACATFAVNSLLLYAISIYFIQKRTAFLISMLFISTNIISYRWPGYSQLSITFVLASLLFFLRYLDRASLRALFISGAAAGLAIFFKQNYGVFITAGLGFILLARLIGRKELKPLLVFSFSFFVPVALTVFYFYSKGALDEMAQYTFISLFQKAASAYYKPYPLISGVDPYFFQREFLDFIPFRALAIWALKEGLVNERLIKNIAAIIYILPLIIIAAGFLYILQSILRTKSVPWKKATLVLLSFFIFLGVFPRSDISHLTFILPPLMITGALLAGKVPLDGPPLFTLKVTAFTLTGLFSLLCLVSAYMPLLYPAPGEIKEAINMPRAYGIKTNRNEAAVIRAITRHIGENTSPVEPILVVPTGAMYYFLTARKSIVPYPLIMPGAMDETSVIKAMEEKKLKYIIYSDMSFDDKRLSIHMPLIQEYITKNYHIDSSYPVRDVGGDTYVLKRGPRSEEIIPLDDGAKEAIKDSAGKGRVYYDFVEKLPEAESGVILGDGRTLALYRANQVSQKAWLQRDAILQEPGKGLSKVYTAFNLRVPVDAALRFSISQSPQVWHPSDGDGALFEVYIYDVAGKRLEKLFSRYLDPKNIIKERRWFNYMAGLKKYGGRDLIIYFVTSGGPRFNLTMGEKNRWRHIDKAGWGTVALIALRATTIDTALSASNSKRADAAETARVMAEIARFDNISLFEQEAQLHPGEYDIRMGLGEVLNQNTYKERAAEEFRLALKIYPGGVKARSLLAKYYINTGRFKTAETLVAGGLALSPGDPALNMTIAGLYRRRREYKKAIGAYGRVLASRPTNEAALLGLSRSYLATGSASRAKAKIDKALSAHPESMLALITLGDYYRFKKDWQNAEEIYRKAIEMAPDKGLAALKLGLTLKARGRTNEAVKLLRSVAAGKDVPAATKKLAEKTIADIMANGIKE
ncbi:MAG: tetratricopeptide repeat protein [Thermodesulfobacteriota bacterium]